MTDLAAISKARHPFVSNTALSEHRFEELLPQLGQRVHVDLGTGLGHFVKGMAQQDPESNWIGLEADGRFLKRAVKRVRRAGCVNVLLFTIDARQFLLEYVTPESLDHIWINFPDPWPKKKHAARRHTHPWMLGLITSRLRVGGELHLATDVPAYEEQMVAGLADIGTMISVSDTPWQRSTIAVETKYERKWRSQDRLITYSDWRKEAPTDLTGYVLDWQPAPALRFTRRPVSGIYGNERHNCKIFRGKFDSNEVGFIFIDRKTGINTPGFITVQDGRIHLRGAWTSWKIALMRELVQPSSHALQP